jgi:alpha-amylase/alpha-mannosidase (GH57 family)
MTTYFAVLLHIYQPPTQDIEILKRINEECYKPLFKMIDETDNAKVTLNINGVLIDLLYEYGLEETMDLIKSLVSESKIEIIGTAKYHPILPLIPEKEIHRQIILNEEINRREFGKNWERKGFFPPELAVSPKVAKIVKEMGYEWIAMSGVSCPNHWPYDRIYQTPHDLKLFFRDDILSNKIAFKKINAQDFIKQLRTLHKNKDDNFQNDTYIIVALDGETFGHHIPNYEKVFLEKVFNLTKDTPKKYEDNIKVCFISKLDNYFPIEREKLVPLKASWSTNHEDIEDSAFYPLWKHPQNTIHQYYWKIIKSLNKLMDLADKLDLTENWDVENYYNTARYFYDQGLHSCPVWWANPLNGTWSPNLIYRGVELLVRAALNAQLAMVNAGVNNGEGYFDSISYYHGLLLMELYKTSKKRVNTKKVKNSKD